MLLFAATFFDRATDYVSGNPWTYGVVLAVVAVDAFFPLVPSETVVITAGTLAAGGDLLVYLVLPVAALGAFAGDNVSYAGGATIGDALAGDRARRRLRWGQKLLDRHGALIIVVARFIPGGRTATTFAAGMLELTWRRFAVYDAAGALVWSIYATLVGYLGGTAFREDIWKALALGFGIALAIAGVIELVRRYGRKG
jgi:membrane protein DedA with SNARE-associated domain